jgi:hypothetical protein
MQVHSKVHFKVSHFHWRNSIYKKAEHIICVYCILFLKYARGDNLKPTESVPSKLTTNLRYVTSQESEDIIHTAAEA